MERADDVVRGGIEFYIPHKAVVRENAQSTKMRIVYDTSARANASVPSLNECREIGPPLQNQLYNLFIRNRFYPVTIAGDLKQALLQIHVRSLTLSLVKRSGKQASRNLAIHSSTLWFSTVSTPLRRSYQTTSTAIQIGEPGTSRGDRAH